MYVYIYIYMYIYIYIYIYIYTHPKLNSDPYATSVRQDIFVKLTEEARRERLRRLDAGRPRRGRGEKGILCCREREREREREIDLDGARVFNSVFSVKSGLWSSGFRAACLRNLGPGFPPVR